MKKLFISLSLLLAAVVGVAQSIKDDFKLVQEVWGKEKKAIVAEALNLSTEEGNKFWPLYDAYQVTRQKIGQNNLAAVAKYSENFGSMTDAKASEIAGMFLKGTRDLNKLQSQYLKKVSKAVSPIKAVQFLQLESYIDSQLKAALYDELPFLPHPKK
jgi:hypothetical protein